MIYVYAILAVVFVILALFFVLPAKIQITLAKKNFADIKLFFFGGVLKIPLKPKEKKSNNSQESKPKESQSEEQKDKSFLEGINNIFRIVNTIRKTYSQSREYVSKRIGADLTVNITFGLYDAALTGIATGAVWTLLYELLGLISTVALIEKHSFNVNPVFDKALLKADGICIFKFRPINIIGVLIHILRKYKKVKAEITNVNTH